MQLVWLLSFVRFTLHSLLYLIVFSPCWTYAKKWNKIARNLIDLCGWALRCRTIYRISFLLFESWRGNFSQSADQTNWIWAKFKPVVVVDGNKSKMKHGLAALMRSDQIHSFDCVPFVCLRASQCVCVTQYVYEIYLERLFNRESFIKRASASNDRKWQGCVYYF